MSKLDSEIKNLVKNLKPVHTLPSPGVSLLQWSFLILATTVFVLLTYRSLRADMMERLGEFHFWASNGLFLGIFLLSTYGFFQMRFPERQVSKFVQVMINLLLIFLFAYSGVELLMNFSHIVIEPVFISHGFACLFASAFSGLIPVIFYGVLAKKGASTSLSQSGWFVGLSVGSLTAIGASLFCADTDSLHFFLWHALPIFLFGFLLSKLALSVLRW